jgi:hypothetical protein
MDAVKPLHRLQQVTHAAKVVQRCAKYPALGTGKRLNKGKNLKWLTGFEGSKLTWLTLFLWYA